MLNYSNQLQQLKKEGKSINVAVVGAGFMGTTVPCTLAQMQAIKPVIIVDLNVRRAVEAFKTIGIKEEDVVVTDSVEKANLVVEDGKYVASSDLHIGCHTGMVDVVVDATGIPQVGAKVAFSSLHSKKHVVMLDLEADVVVGSILKKYADDFGVVYTGSDGDEPGVCLGLYDAAKSLGFSIIAAGKCKYAFTPTIEYYTTPDNVAERARILGMNPNMLCSFIDGTKTMNEMNQLSNATGLVPEIRGMHGPASTLEDLPKVFSLGKEGGILKETGVVDYAFVKGYDVGVFVIATLGEGTEQSKNKIGHILSYLKMGNGPNYAFFRQYHLAGVETPLSILKAYFEKASTIAPLGAPISETITIAKRDLEAGEIIDGSGGYTVFGLLERAEIAKKDNLVPIGLAEGSKTKRSIRKGKEITYDDIELNEDFFIVQLRRMQDKAF